jgi:hypothetical protein
VKIYVAILEAIRKKEKGDEISQSEPTTTNALVPYSIHWMGYVFSLALNRVHHSPFYCC